MMSKLVIVTMPPDVVLTLASSTVFVKASSLVNRDFAGIVARPERDVREAINRSQITGAEFRIKGSSRLVGSGCTERVGG